MLQFQIIIHTFATSMAGPEAPMVAYATVHPLTMLLRILCAQVLPLALCQ
jgi:putative transport protein